MKRVGAVLAGAFALAGCGDPPGSSTPAERLAAQQQALTIAVPKRLKALDFHAFGDSDTVHEGNCGSGPVDSETTTDPNGGTCNVAFTKAGEWLDYSVAVPTTGSYGLTARVASALTAKTFRLALDGQDLAGVLTAPSTGWQAFADRSVAAVSMTAGTHTLRLSFVTGDVNLNYIDVVPGRVALPARIEAETYQRAFESTPNANSGGGCDRADGVDAQTTADAAGGGCNIGWTTAGEWLEYDVSVAQAGQYDVLLRVASGATGKTAQVLLDGTSVGAITAPSVGFTTFQDRVLPKVQFSAGNHTLRVTLPAGDVNLNYLNVTTSAPVALVPKRIKSIDYSAFQDSDAVHEGSCGSGPVDAETTTDPNGGGCNVGWTKAGEWLEYLISVPTTGKYQLNARVASGSTAKTFRFFVDGVVAGAALTAPSAGWQAFADRGVSNVNLTAGQHTLRVAFDTGDVNLNYLEVSPGTVTVPARIEAELYQRAFDSTPATNAGGGCDRADGVDKQSSTDGSGSGCDIVAAAGEWIELDVNVAQAGAFDIKARASSATAGTSLRFGLDGTDIGTLTVPNQGLATYQDRTLAKVNIGTGAHVLRITLVAGQANLNYLHLATAAGCTTDASCSDNDACNGAERCALGQCVAGASPVLDDGNVCTVDSCVAATGVVHTNAADGTSCGDSNACTTADKCVAGSCQGTAVVCVALDSCHVAGTCDDATGVCSSPVRPAGSSCSDGNACNGAEACSAAGQCLAGTAPTMDDANPCTVDSCDSALGVLHVAAAPGTTCDDATVCNGREACNATGQCQPGTTAPGVDDGNPCTTDSCNAISGVSHVPRSAGASCSNGDACDGIEACNGSGSCVASSAPTLDDGNPCTVDSCDAVQGVQHQPATSGLACSVGACTAVGACNSSGTCVGGPPVNVDDGNPCTVDTCDELGGVKHTLALAGTSCSDSNACNGAEACSTQGACLAGAAPPLDDHNPCTIDSCDAITGVAHAPASLGQACDDQTVCNGHETCNGAGACTPGTPLSLEDGNECTADACDPSAGVTHLPWQLGFPCADDDACNGEEACNGAGQCVASTPPVVDDDNPCTADSCDPDGGVKHMPVAIGLVCSSANACHAAGTCGAEGQCVEGAPTTVDDGNPCTSDSCNPDAGVLHTPIAAGTSCSNGNACDGAEQCSASGACVAGTPLATDDANPCTADRCDPVTGVLHTPVTAGTSCADGNLCNGAEACLAGGVCAPGSPLVTDDANPCTADACDPLQGVSNSPVAAGNSCSDGNPCNGVEACTVGGACVASGAPLLNDGNSCTADSCDPVLGVRHVAVAAGTSCADADACNGAEVCTAAGACVLGSFPVLDDGNPCTADSCSGGVVQHLPVTSGTACSDGNLCNGLEVCSAGVCAPGSSPVLDDGNVCTVDGCDLTTGSVTHSPAPNGTACDDATVCNGHEACQSGSCQAGTPLALEDGNPCTADSCSPTGGVTHQPVPAGTACDDVTVCNGHEACSAGGQCLPGSALVLDDGNPCTTDSCSEAGGVEHQPAQPGTSCSDGDACNGQEQCSAAGACVTTSAPVLDDGNPCTVDACSPGSGTVQHTPLPGGVACADSDLCNGNEVCSGSGTCVPGTPASVDDGNPCTVDSCDPLVGVRHLPLDTPECVGRAGWARVIGSQPSPRDGAAGVFIGTGELLLFGGDNAGAVLADAWLWSPTTRAWRRVASGPSARAGASLSFDAARQRAVLFGGVSSAAQGAQYLNDVWEYDSSADAWSKRTVTSTSPAPRALASFAFDSARGRALLFGGTNESALDDTWEWDSAQGRWAQLSTSGPSARYGAAFAFDDTTRSYALFGGSPGNATGALGDTWLLAADTGVWTGQVTAAAPAARAAAGMAFDADAQRLVLFGGTGVTSLNLDDTWELSTATGVWSALPTLAAPTSTTAAVVGFDSQTRSVVVASGLSYSSSGRFTPQSSAVWLLDRVAQRWTDRSSTLAPPQLRYGAAFDTRRKVIVAMGTRAPPERPLMWSFDSRAAQWSVQDVTDVDHPFSAGEFNGVADGTNPLFYAAPLGVVLEVRHKELAQWDGERWTKRCDYPSVGALGAQYETSAAYDAAHQRLYLFGGGIPGGFEQLRNEVIALDVTTCAAELLQPTTNSPPNRKSASSTWDSDRGRLIVFGGLDYSLGPSRDTWEFDPVGRTWTALSGAMPPARSGATSVYDPARHRVILHGGRGESALLYDTWELDPASGSWRQLVTAGPSDGEQAALTFDTIRNSAALVSTRGAVWHLSGENWTSDLNPVSPSARSGFSGGFGPQNGVGVFFGGTSGDGQRDFLGDVWIWRDGWRGVYPGIAGSPLVSYGQGSASRSGSAVPGGRTGHVLVSGLVDTWAKKDVFLLFGGEGASDKYLGLYGDTWTFDATTMEWTPLAGSVSPRGRTAHAMSVFPNRGYVMFGGLGRNRFPSGSAKDILKDFSFSDTWIWEFAGGGYWHRVAEAGPSARYGHAMATDENAREIILFGGRDDNGVSGETWRLDLTSLSSTAVWQKLSPPSSPLSRFGHSMTWDPVRQRIVLTGGEGASASQTFEDTWEWDSPAQRWVPRNVAPLDGRAGHVSFFDRKRGLLLAFGGFSHRDAGSVALTHGDTLAFYRPSEADPSGGLTNGSRCSSATECGSGACVDGFCCNSTCGGQCGACDLPGFEGVCSPVAGAPHGTRQSCGSSGAECASQCNGSDMTQCNVPPLGTPCGPQPGCADENTLVSARGNCDATGACVVPQVSCGNYRCCGADDSSCAANPRCRTICQVTGESSSCITGYKCNGPGQLPFGQCYKPTQITAFIVTPATAKVGIPMTFTVTTTEPNTSYDYDYTFGSGFRWPTCSGPTCTWTPAAADVGKTATWRVSAGNAPGISNSRDDSKTMTLTVQP